MSSSRCVFTTYQGVKKLYDTTVEDIPREEQYAYWALLRVPPEQFATVDEENRVALHRVWLDEQQRRRTQRKVVVQICGGVVQHIYCSEGLKLELAVLDVDRLEREGMHDEFQRRDFVCDATQLLRRHSEWRVLDTKDPYA